MVEFTPKGGDGARAGSQGPPGEEKFPLSHAEVVAMMRQAGHIPDDVPDENVVIHAMSRAGTSVTLTSDAETVPEREWHEGDVFPHTSFDDPPYLATPEQYKEILLGTLREAGSLEVFTEQLKEGLGRDMVLSHDVPPDMADRACTEFAARLYEEYA